MSFKSSAFVEGGVFPLALSPAPPVVLPSLLTPKMIFMHVEFEEHMECANAHYLRKSGLYNNNNAPSVLHPPVIFAISMCTFDFSCYTTTISYSPLSCLLLKSPVIGRDAHAYSVK